jgi:hypothetical protein
VVEGIAGRGRDKGFEIGEVAREICGAAGTGFD